MYVLGVLKVLLNECQFRVPVYDLGPHRKTNELLVGSETCFIIALNIKFLEDQISLLADKGRSLHLSPRSDKVRLDSVHSCCVLSCSGVVFFPSNFHIKLKSLTLANSTSIDDKV